MPRGVRDQLLDFIKSTIGSPFSVLLPKNILAPVALLIPVIFNFHVKISFFDLKLADPFAVQLTRGISFFDESFDLYFSFCPNTYNPSSSNGERINEVIAKATIEKEEFDIYTHPRLVRGY